MITPITRKIIFGCIAFVLFSIFAQAGSDKVGPYITARGAALWMQNIDVSGSAFGKKVDFDLSYKPGSGALLGFGYRGLSGLAFEISGGYYTAGFDKASFNVSSGKQDFSTDLNINADLTFIPVNANLAMNVSATKFLDIYAGLGIGATHCDLQVGKYANVSSWELGGEAFAGLNVNFSEAIGLSAGYRLLVFGVESAPVLGHTAEAGIVIRF